MHVLNATEARKTLYKLIDHTFDSHEPMIIKGKRHNAVLISEEDWKAMQETIYLLSIPGMRESIKEGLETSLEQTTSQIDW